MLPISIVMLSGVGRHVHLKIDMQESKRPSTHLWHPVGQLDNVKLPAVRPDWGLVTKQPNCWPGSDQLVSVHLNEETYLVFWSQIQTYLSWQSGPDFNIAPVFHSGIGGSRPHILRLNLARSDFSIRVLLCLDRDLTAVVVLFH